MNAIRKPHQYATQFCAVILLTILCAVTSFASEPQSPPTASEPPSVQGAKTLEITGRSKAGLPVCTMHFGGKPFAMEIASTSAHREKGLGGRAQLLSGKGMLFVHPSAALRSYWMKDCLFNMDIAYLDSSGRIVAMYTMKIEPPQRPGEPTRNYKKRLKEIPEQHSGTVRHRTATRNDENLGPQRWPSHHSSTRRPSRTDSLKFRSLIQFKNEREEQFRNMSQSQSGLRPHAHTIHE